MTDSVDELEAAAAAFVRALGVPELADPEIPARVANLWRSLIRPQRQTPGELFAGSAKATQSEPIVVGEIGVHLVCPHHLTIALGEAAVAYLPGEKIAGFGSLSSMVEECCGRPAFQEDATAEIASGIVAGLGAIAAVVTLRARHPCNSLKHPRAHGAESVTWASSGQSQAASTLREHLLGYLSSKQARPSSVASPK